jgi:hypothetical protein
MTWKRGAVEVRDLLESGVDPKLNIHVTRVKT